MKNIINSSACAQESREDGGRDSLLLQLHAALRLALLLGREAHELIPSFLAEDAHGAGEAKRSRVK